MTFSDYIEDLASRHVDIRHIKDDEVHFVSSESEQYTSIDSILNYPAVVLDKGDGFSYTGIPGAYRKNKGYILIIVDHIKDTSDYNEINNAIEKCEGLLDDFMNKIIEDKLKPSFKLLKAFKLEDVEVDYIKNNDNSLYGVVATLPLESSYKSHCCKSKFIENN